MAFKIASVVYIAILARRIYNAGMDIVVTVLAIPFGLGLIMLAVVSRKVTSILREHGLKMGFFGADVSQFKNAA